MYKLHIWGRVKKLYRAMEMVFAMVDGRKHI